MTTILRLWGNVARGGVGARPKEVGLHLLHQVLASTGVREVQPVLVHQHGLLLEPVGPGLLGHALKDAAAEIARRRWEVKARRLALEFHAMYESGHALEYAMDKIWIQAALVASGAVVGAWLRWGVGLALGGLLVGFNLGTLVVNLVGGLLAGGLLAWSAATSSQLLPDWARLLLMTGFLGSLTTFSALTAEMLPLVQAGRWIWAFTLAAMHVILALVAAVFGFYLIDLIVKK
jgi:CrcB protein